MTKDTVDTSPAAVAGGVIPPVVPPPHNWDSVIPN